MPFKNVDTVRDEFCSAVIHQAVHFIDENIDRLPKRDAMDDRTIEKRIGTPVIAVHPTDAKALMYLNGLDPFKMQSMLEQSLANIQAKRRAVVRKLFLAGVQSMLDEPEVPRVECDHAGRPIIG